MRARRNNASEKCIRLLRRGALAHRLRHLRQKRQVRFKSSYHPSRRRPPPPPPLRLSLSRRLLFSCSRHLLHARFRALERASPAGGADRRRDASLFIRGNLFWKIPSTVKARGIRAPSFCGGLSERSLPGRPVLARRGEAKLLEPCVL